ncbi:calcium-binding protein [Ensifer soli]|uniref:calcium-binding protein n=1 Tax=Ciceribacter sp. sgz301302 TaxID=3342379 RepID=UPI0035B7ED43
MAIRIVAKDANGDGTGINLLAYLDTFEDTFVRSGYGQFSGANRISGKEYAFTDGGADKYGVVLGASQTDWAYNMTTHVVGGSLGSVSFGTQTTLDAAKGAFTQVLDLKISGLGIDDADAAAVALSELMAADADSIVDALKSDTLVFIGSTGKDTVTGYGGNDKLYGHGGNDLLTGGAGNDRLVGGDGNDVLLGGSGNDVIFGQNGNDRVRAGTGNDTVKGGAGNDTLYGDAGNDKLYGEAGNDVIHGGAGNDRINGGAGDDRLTGGAGRDVFIFGKNTGNDVITDFDAGAAVGDQIVLDKDVIASFAALQAAAEDSAAGLVIAYGEGSITLTGVELADLHRNDFAFV